MSKRFGRNRRRKMRNAIETLTSEVVRVRIANQDLREKLERVGEELGRFSVMNPNPHTVDLHNRVWEFRIANDNHNWETIRDRYAPYKTMQHLTLCDARLNPAGYNRLFSFIGGFPTASDPVVFVPYAEPFALARSIHFAVRDVNTGLVVNYAFPTEVLFTVPRTDLCRILGERLGEIALQGLYEQFDAKTHKEFLKALAEAGKDPMQPSHTLSGRGVLK